MSLVVEYESLDEAQMRLDKTVVLYDGEPVYITRVANLDALDVGQKGKDIFRVYAVPLPLDRRKNLEADEFRKYISSKKFDLKTIKMGFMNRGGKVFYCSRAPRRQYKQGLSDATLSCLPLEKNKGYIDKIRLAELVYDKAFVDTIKGKYPSFDDARKMLEKEDTQAVAFNREYALRKDEDLEGLIYLYYKLDKVGFILDDRIHLDKSNAFLKDALREIGIRV